MTYLDLLVPACICLPILLPFPFPFFHQAMMHPFFDVVDDDEGIDSVVGKYLFSCLGTHLFSRDTLVFLGRHTRVFLSCLQHTDE